MENSSRDITKLMSKSKNVQIFAAILASFIAAFIFTIIDKSEATFFDYTTLESSAHEIEKDPNSIFNTECEVDVIDDEIVVTLENSNCYIKAHYTKDFKLYHIERSDKAVNIFLAIFFSIFIFIICFYTLQYITDVFLETIFAIRDVIKKNFVIKR